MGQVQKQVEIKFSFGISGLFLIFLVTKATYMDYLDELPTSTLIIWIVVAFAIAVFMIAAMWKVFTKAGQPGWAAIIPIYNMYIMTKIGGKPGWWVFLMLIPVVNYIFVIWLYNMISKSFGKDEAFTVGLVILGMVFWPILGFGNAKYQGPFGDPVAYQAYQEQHKFDFEKQA